MPICKVVDANTNKEIRLNPLTVRQVIPNLIDNVPTSYKVYAQWTISPLVITTNSYDKIKLPLDAEKCGCEVTTMDGKTVLVNLLFVQKVVPVYPNGKDVESFYKIYLNGEESALNVNVASAESLMEAMRGGGGTGSVVTADEISSGDLGAGLALLSDGLGGADWGAVATEQSIFGVIDVTDISGNESQEVLEKIFNNELAGFKAQLDETYIYAYKIETVRSSSMFFIGCSTSLNGHPDEWYYYCVDKVGGQWVPGVDQFGVAYPFVTAPGTNWYVHATTVRISGTINENSITQEFVIVSVTTKATQFTSTDLYYITSSSIVVSNNKVYFVNPSTSSFNAIGRFYPFSATQEKFIPEKFFSISYAFPTATPSVRVYNEDSIDLTTGKLNTRTNIMSNGVVMLVSDTVTAL